MVAVVNSVVVAACTGLVLVAAGVHSLAIPVAAGALVGIGAFALRERLHRRALAQLPPGGCRSRRDPDSASRTVPRGLKTNHHVADLTWLPGPPPARRRRPVPPGQHVVDEFPNVTASSGVDGVMPTDRTTDA